MSRYPKLCTILVAVYIYACMCTNMIYFRSFKSRRTLIERCFGIMKNSYAAAGTRHWRGKKHIGPVICNVSASLFNRRWKIFQALRDITGNQYMP